MSRGSYYLLHLERALPEGERCDVRDDLAVCTDNCEKNFCLSLVMKSRSEKRVVMRNGSGTPEHTMKL